jgi:hypothetical protein
MTVEEQRRTLVLTRLAAGALAVPEAAELLGSRSGRLAAERPVR